MHDFLKYKCAEYENFFISFIFLSLNSSSREIFKAPIFPSFYYKSPHPLKDVLRQCAVSVFNSLMQILWEDW